MAHRSKTGQGKHDKAVKQLAAEFKNDGFKVRVDLPGCVKPGKIKGFIPDIEAKKGSQRIIAEVETEDSMESDLEQRRAFRQAADEQKNTTFKLKKV